MATIATLSETRPTRRPGVWAAPALLGCAVFATLMVLADSLLQDPDSQWHVALGSRIWRDRAVPWTDDYSHTFASAPWIAKEWLAQVLLAGAHAAAGWSGPVILVAATLAGLFAILFGWLRRRLRGTVAFAATLLALTFLAPHFLARPLVFGLLALLAWTIGLAAAREANRAPAPLLLAVMVLWSNLHGSFTFGYVLAGLIGVEAMLAAPRGERLAAIRDWSFFGLASLAAGCIGPYGIAAIGVTATLFGSGESLPYLTEWQPLGVDATGLTMLASAAALVVALAFEPRRNLVRISIVGLVAAMTLRHSRFLDVYAIVVPVLVAGPLARRFAALRREPETDADATSRLASWPVLAAALAVAALSPLLHSPRPAASVTPARALQAARESGLTGPVYNDYDFGGFLIAEGVPTFIDGRTDQLFLGGFISGLFRAIRSEEPGPFLSLLDRYGVGWALVRPASPEAAHLRSTAAWRQVYADENAAVFVRNREKGLHVGP